jgi:ABC-type cobalamin/Fe3+-siderophores transport system ATPase subunit
MQMKIPSFRIQNQKSISLAACENVPRLMVVAGPNGCGKTTLLNALRHQAGNGQVLYVGPHRNTRRQQVQWQYLLSAPITMWDLLSRDDVPGYSGINLVQGTRDAWGFDDSGNYLKHGLCQIEVDRQEAISVRYDHDKEIQKDSLPDPWNPLRDLTNNLLPHLSFYKIDPSNRTQVKCLWRVHGKENLVDLDDLSSGEKSVIQMFYPLIEQKIKTILSEIRRDKAPSQHKDTCLLIDEPELHLHPNLQVKVYDYLRLLASEEDMQIIIATHSPTIVEYATFDELFLLRPMELINAGENQLVRVATDEERLHFLRDVFGTTSNYTAMQRVVVVEGQNESSSTVPDRKLYRALNPHFDHLTVISGGGKSECIKLVDSLNESLQQLSPHLKAVALLDRDLASGTESENTHILPVSMIENFLLDPNVIWDTLQSVIEKTGWSSVEDVATALDKVLDDYEPYEIERRTLASLGIAIYRPKSPLSDINKNVSEFTTQTLQRFSRDNISLLFNESTNIVLHLKQENKRRELFHGKDLIDQLFKISLHKTGMSKSIFLFEAARHARRRKSVTQFFEQFIKELEKV